MPSRQESLKRKGGFSARSHDDSPIFQNTFEGLRVFHPINLFPSLSSKPSPLRRPKKFRHDLSAATRGPPLEVLGQGLGSWREIEIIQLLHHSLRKDENLLLAVLGMVGDEDGAISLSATLPLSRRYNRKRYFPLYLGWIKPEKVF
jgi:hypothetical protein